jgi:hypothetical protein
LKPARTAETKSGGSQKVGRVLIWSFSERGCARSVSRSEFKMLRLVSDTAALPSNQDTPKKFSALL